MVKKVFSHLLAIALVILVSCFMPLFLFLTNVEAISFIEIAIFMGVFSAVGLILFAVLRFTTKSPYKAASITAVVTLIYQNIGRLQPLMGHWLVLLLFAVLMIMLGIIVKKLITEEIAKVFTPVFAIMLTFLCLLNTVTNMGRISAKMSVDSDVKAEVEEQYSYLSSFKKNSLKGKLPNIYFFIPDEYAGFNSLEKFLDYDNKEFKDFLESNNFQVSKTSTNYSSGTMECLADVFNLEINEDNRYHSTSEAYCKRKTAQGALFRMVEDMGYNVRTFQPIDLIDYESQSVQYGKIWSTNADGDLSIDIMFSPTVIYSARDAFLQILDLFSGGASVGKDVIHNLANSNAEPLRYFARDDAQYPDSTFNFCYGLIPHNPFYFDAQGNFVDANLSLNDWTTKDQYLNQLKYTTSLLTQSINNIIENDPDSIIIIMSDHGLRVREEATDTWMKGMTPKDNADILCAVYFKGEEFTDIEGMCGANVMITIMNEVYGYEIPYIAQSDDFYFEY